MLLTDGTDFTSLLILSSTHMKNYFRTLGFILFSTCSLLSCDNDNESNNGLPDLTITAPEDKSTITAGTDVKIQALATEENGKIKQVDFYEGKNLLFEDTIAPYEYTWPEVKSGDYTLSVTTVNEDGAEMGSASITIKVVDQNP